MQPLIPVIDRVEVFWQAHAPVQVYRVLEARSAAMLDQAVHLRHAGAGGHQHQRPIGQFSQVRVAKRQFDAGHLVALQLLDQAACAVFPRQYMQLQFTPGVGCRGQGKRRFLAILPLDHEVLPGVVTQRLAGRGAQAHTPHIATDFHTFDQLTRQFAQR